MVRQSVAASVLIFLSSAFPACAAETSAGGVVAFSLEAELAPGQLACAP